VSDFPEKKDFFGSQWGCTVRCVAGEILSFGKKETNALRVWILDILRCCFQRNPAERPSSYHVTRT